jgi:hypothetical protein
MACDREHAVCNYTLNTYNVARGRGHYYVVYTYDLGDPSDQYRVADFAVSAQGFLAWQEVQPGTAHPYGAIRVHDTHGTRTLDSAGPDDFSDLAIQDETVHWKKNGVPASASLG